MSQTNLNEKLFTPNFLILWQAQLVSTLGDTVYSIALGVSEFDIRLKR